MKSILKKYQQLQGKPFEHIGKMGRVKDGFIDDFDHPIWHEKYGVLPIKCAPNVIEFSSEELPEPKKDFGENIDSKSDIKKNKNKDVKFDIYGVPIIKLEIKGDEIDNPITPEMIIDAFKYFKIPEDHFKGLEEIVISNELPEKKWAFGTYNIRKKNKKLIDNRITIWAQKVVIMNGEKRYMITPSNVPGPMYLTSARFHYEILGDTIIHELGHHFDLWINESPMVANGWIVRAENFAEKYTRSFVAIKRRSEEFLNFMVTYGEQDNNKTIEKVSKNNNGKMQDIKL